MKFRELVLYQRFDWINDSGPNSFFDRCVKTGSRKYRSITTDIEYTVGSINATVYHPEPLGD